MPLHDEIEEQADSTTASFRMVASAPSLIEVNIFGFVLGALLLGLLLRARGLYSPVVNLIMIIVLGFYFLGDTLQWRRRGIRRVEVDADGITFYRGPREVPQRVDATQMTEVTVLEKLKRRSVVVYCGGRSVRPVPGVTLFLGARVLITNDAFNDAEFDRFVQLVCELDRRRRLS